MSNAMVTGIGGDVFVIICFVLVIIPFAFDLISSDVRNINADLFTFRPYKKHEQLAYAAGLYQMSIRLDTIAADIQCSESNTKDETGNSIRRECFERASSLTRIAAFDLMDLPRADNLALFCYYQRNIGIPFEE